MFGAVGRFYRPSGPKIPQKQNTPKTSKSKKILIITVSFGHGGGPRCSICAPPHPHGYKPRQHTTQLLSLPTDNLTEWLRRPSAKLGVGSNPAGVVFDFLSPPRSVTSHSQYGLMLIIMINCVLTSEEASGLIAQLVRAYGQ